MLLKNNADEDEAARAEWIEKNGDDPNNPWVDTTPPETIREEFYRLNPETLTCGDYTIVVFEDNQAMRSLGASLMDAGK